MPWLFGIALFAMSILLYSQAATVRALMPLDVYKRQVEQMPQFPGGQAEMMQFIRKNLDSNSQIGSMPTAPASRL